MNENSLDYNYQINGFNPDAYSIDFQAVTKDNISYGKRWQIEGRKTASYTAKRHISEKIHTTHSLYNNMVTIICIYTDKINCTCITFRQPIRHDGRNIHKNTKAIMKKSGNVQSPFPPH